MLLAVALRGTRRPRLWALGGAVAAAGFTVHALAKPPTNGANIFDPALSVPNYFPNSPTAGAGETVGAGGAGGGRRRAAAVADRATAGRPAALTRAEGRSTPAYPRNHMSVVPADRRRELPDEPGVYLFRDERGRVIYVGKAISIRKRVASHFANPSTRAGRDLVPMIDQIEALVVHTEAEALIAEQNFIKQYKPRFNIRLRDDKSYPYIAISLDEEFPRVYFTAGAPSSRPRLLRPVQQRQAGALDAGRAGQGVHVPLLRGSGSRAGAVVPPAWTTTSSAARPRAWAMSAGRTTGPGSMAWWLPFRPLPGDRAQARVRDAPGRRRAALRGRRPGAQPPAGGALAAGAPAGVQRERGHARRDRHRHRGGGGQRPGLPGPRRGALRPPELLSGQRRRRGARRCCRGVHPAVLRQRDDDPAAAGGPARGGRRPGAGARRCPSAGVDRWRSARPSGAASDASWSLPSATPGWLWTRRSCARSAAASSGSNPSTASSRRWASTPSRCESSALTSPR